MFACLEKEALLFWGYLIDALNLLFPRRPTKDTMMFLRIPSEGEASSRRREAHRLFRKILGRIEKVSTVEKIIFE